MRFVLFLVFFSPVILFSAINYDVRFYGISNEGHLKIIKDTSTLVFLKNKPPRSLNALKYRIESDLPGILKILKSNGYFDASITYEIEQEDKGVTIDLFIDTGPRYNLTNFDIFETPCEEKKRFSLSQISIDNLGIELNHPVSFHRIEEEKDIFLDKLAEAAYPLASIQKTEILVDTEKKSAQVEQCVAPGPFCKFGPITISGAKDILPAYILKKIGWKENEPYSPQKIEITQNRLIASQLFTSAMITHAQELDGAGMLPMKIKLVEAEHKKIAIAASYATVDGFGGSFGFLNRNLRGMGDIFQLTAEVFQHTYGGIAKFIKPDFIILDQNFVTQVEGKFKKIRVYHYADYNAVVRIDRKFHPHTDFSIGLKGEHMHVMHSIKNGEYNMLSLPIFVKYSTANNLFNPSRGIAVIYQGAMHQDIDTTRKFFLRQRFTFCFYIPYGPQQKLIFAMRTQLCSVAGTKQKYIPLPKLFYGGSDDDLRGYRYHTVSPLNEEHDPIGGRSAIYLSFEPRLRFNDTFGLVPFFDMGNVEKGVLPTTKGKWHKSVGIGIRYFTFLGPLRFDVGFPLNRRNFDPHFRIYASIGQSF